MMIPEIDTPIEYVHYSWKELKNQGLPAGARWKNRKNVLASANEIQANLLLITKRFHIQEMLDCIVFSSNNVSVPRRRSQGFVTRSCPTNVRGTGTRELRCPGDSITDVSPPLYLIPQQCHQC